MFIIVDRSESFERKTMHMYVKTIAHSSDINTSNIITVSTIIKVSMTLNVQRGTT